MRSHLAQAGDLADGSGWRIRMRAAREAGDSMAAREVALETARSGGSSGTRSAAWLELGRLRLAAGETDRARAAFLEAMDTEWAGSAVHAARELSELSPGPEEWRRIGAIYARHGNARRAAEGFRAYLDAGIGTPAERARARLSLGEARYNAGRYSQAERGLLELSEDEVAPAIAARALYLAGRAQYRQGRNEDGQGTLARLGDRFPDQEVTARGLYLLADLKHDDLEIADAKRYYRAAVEAAPDVNEAGLSLMRLGGLAFLEGDYPGALTLYEEYRDRHPNGRRWDQATYWAARSLDALGRAVDARSRLRELREREPLSYYGVRAAGRLDEPVLAISMPAGPESGAAVDSAVNAGLRRVDLLARLDRRDDVVREVERLRYRFEDDDAAAYALAERLTERGYTRTAIGMGGALYRRRGGWDDRLLRIVYPFPYQNLVLPESREKALDPYLVAGLIRRESAFNPTVTSSAGAIGLMQVMPETGRTLARAVSLRDFEPDLLRQPEVNVDLGTRYFAEMLERFDGDLPLVLSAYNAGPTRARRWRELPEARDPELFTERVPYGETRDYIRNVLLHRALYGALYPGLGETDAGGSSALPDPGPDVGSR
ncbi:MAG: transglycosylase SLT domain-containing protein [Gemmatimonadota bacterium]